MRQSWTDDRLDDFRHNVDRHFDEVRADIKGVNADIKALQAEINQRFDKLQRLMIQFCGGALLTVIGALLSLAATQL